jgi:hypothetical protein
MSAAPLSLADLQARLLNAITRNEDHATRVHDEILPSHQQSAAERLAVYQHAYLARLLDVLRELFPCTRFAVGDDLFDQFAAGYLRRYPPHSYTLAILAEHWVEYLDETRPVDAEWGGFVVELSRLEQAIDRIFDGPGPEGLPPFSLPPDANAEMRLTFVPGFELHTFYFPVSTYFTAWKAGQQPAWPDRREQFIALFRHDYIVRRHELSREQFVLLTAIARGQTLAESLAAIADASPTNVIVWFSEWSASGLFSRAAAP